MFDIDAQHVGDQARGRTGISVALAQDRFHAFADAFAFGFQILQQSLARDQAGAMFLGGAELLADLRDLLAERGCFRLLGFELRLLLGDVGRSRRRASPEARCAAFERFDLARTMRRRSAKPRLLGGDVLPLDLDRAQPAVDLASLRIRSRIGGLVLLDFLIELVELKLPVAKRLLALLDLLAVLLEARPSAMQARRFRFRAMR